MIDVSRVGWWRDPAQHKRQKIKQQAIWNKLELEAVIENPSVGLAEMMKRLRFKLKQRWETSLFQFYS
jgi:hypothetical protein